MNTLKHLFTSIESKFEMERWYNSYALANLAAGGVSILIPLYVLHLGGGVDDIGLLTAVGNLVGVPASIIWGTLSDRWGMRKIFAIIGFLGVAISFFLMGIVNSYRSLILLNATYILFWMSAASVVTVLIIEKEDRDRWDCKIGSFNVSAGLGWSIGLALGFIWTTVSAIILHEGSGASLRYLFLALGAFAFFGAVLAAKLIPEDVKFERKGFRGRMLEAGDMITERFRYVPAHLYYLLKPSRLVATVHKFGVSLAGFLTSVAIIYTGFSIFFIPLPAYLKVSAGLGNEKVYLLFIANALASALLYRVAARWTRKIGAFRVLRVSLLARVILFPGLVAPFLLIGSTGLQVLVAALIIVFIGTSWAFINISTLVIVSKLSPERIKGQVFGVYNGIIGLSAVGGSLIGGYVAQFGNYLVAFLIASLLIASGLALAVNRLKDVELLGPGGGNNGQVD